MKKVNKALSYNPGRRDIISGASALAILTLFAIYGLILDSGSTIGILLTLMAATLDAASAYFFYRDPARKTSVTIKQNGIYISFSSGDAPIVIPWSADVHVNICILDEYVCNAPIVRRRVLCLSNYDIGGGWFSYEQSINWTHKMPSDCSDRWIVFLVVTDLTAKWKNERKKVCALKNAALSREQIS